MPTIELSLRDMVNGDGWKYCPTGNQFLYILLILALQNSLYCFLLFTVAFDGELWRR
jgi:hypothetical protein